MLDDLAGVLKPFGVRLPRPIALRRFNSILIYSYLIQTAPLIGSALQLDKAPLDFMQIGGKGHHFAFSKSRTEFKPWGFNYDHDRTGRLLEGYWNKEWDAVVADFQEMTELKLQTAQ